MPFALELVATEDEVSAALMRLFDRFELELQGVRFLREGASPRVALGFEAPVVVDVRRSADGRCCVEVIASNAQRARDVLDTLRRCVQ